MTFVPSGKFTRYAKQIEGVVKDPDGRPVYTISGFFDKYISFRPADTNDESQNVTIWEETTEYNEETYKM